MYCVHSYYIVYCTVLDCINLICLVYCIAYHIAYCIHIKFKMEATKVTGNTTWWQVAHGTHITCSHSNHATCPLQRQNKQTTHVSSYQHGYDHNLQTFEKFDHVASYNDDASIYNFNIVTTRIQALINWYPYRHTWLYL